MTRTKLRLAVLSMHVAEKFIDEDFRTRDGHLIQALARRSDIDEIVLLDRPVVVAELASRRRRLVEATAEAIRAREPNVRLARLRSRAVVRPIVERRDWWLSAYDPQMLTVRSLRRARAQLSMLDAAIVFVPTASSLWKGTRTPVVLDLVDNWGAHPQLGASRRNAYHRAYAQSLAAAQAVVANSEATKELARAHGRDATLIPNGVDQRSVTAAASSTQQLWRGRLGNAARPWFVYVGKLQERLDTGLVARLASHTGTVVLAGPILNRAWLRPLLTLPNVRWLGDVPYCEVAGLIACADVALIPHRVGAGEIGGDPQKIYEYAAVGARIATTPISGCSRFARYADVVACGEEFVRRVVELGCDERPLTKRLEASPLREQDSWDARADALMEVVDGARRSVHQGRAT
jgi:Glycosyltransferase Family 4